MTISVWNWPPPTGKMLSNETDSALRAAVAHWREILLIVKTLLPFGLGQICAMLSLLGLAKTMTPEQFGQLSFGLAIQTYLVLIGGMGIKTLVLREAAANRADHSKLITAHVAITVTASTIVMITAALCLWGFDKSIEETRLHGWLLLGAWFSAVNPSAFLDARGRQPLTQMVTAVTEFAFLLALILGFIPPTLSAVGCGFSIKWILASALHSLFVLQTDPPFQWSRDQGRTRGLLRSGWSLLITSLIATWPISGTVIFVRTIDGPESAAIMGFTAQAATAYLLVAGVGYRLLQPRLREPTDVFDTCPLQVVLQVATCLGLIWLFALGASWGLIAWWLPVAFRSAGWTATMMLVSSLLGCVGYFGWACLLAAGQERLVLKCYLLGNVTFLALIVPAVLWAGEEGAASCSVASMFLIVIQMSCELHRAARRYYGRQTAIRSSESLTTGVTVKSSGETPANSGTLEE